MPVFGFHQTTLSRLAHLGAEAPKAAGVRLILPDRPGSGRSDDQPGRRLLDWPEDVAELADAIGVERFAVFGASGGGPHAAACGVGLADRVASVGLVGSNGPAYDVGEVRAAIPPARRELVELARRDLEAAVSEIRREVEEDLEADFRALPAEPAADHAVVKDPEIRPRLLAAARETAAHGPEGIVRDLTLTYLTPWGFGLQEIPVPVHVWQGDADPVVPVAVARYVAGAVRDCSLRIYAGEGHMLLWAHAEEILRTLAESV